MEGFSMKITKTMRFLLVALAAAMVFSLFACTDPVEGETTAPQGNETTEAPGGETTAPTGNETTEVPGNETTAPVGGEATETTAPVGGDTTETTAPAGGDTTETTAPAGGDTTETTAPTGGDDTTETTAPTGGDVTEPVAGETKDNPIYVDFAADMTATVTVPAGKTYYFSSYRNIGGMLLSINGGEGVLLEGNMMNPPVFSITNDGAEDAEYALALTYPVGTQMNPEVLEYLEGYVTLAEGDSDGYYYTYTAEADGIVTVYVYSYELPEGVTADIIVTNMNTSVQKTLLEDGVDNFGLELAVEVKASDVLMIQIITVPVDFVNPAAEFSWGGMFTYPLGTENNPIYPEVEWNDKETEGTATVTAPVGTTYYSIPADGAYVVINDGEPILLAGRDNPTVFAITNEGEAAADYAIKVYYPAGHFMNPIVIESIDEALTANVGANSEVYYKWTATADGLLSVTTTNALASITVKNNTQYIYNDPSEGAGTAYMPIAYGDDISFVVTTVMDFETWTSPAADVDMAFAVEPATMLFDQTVTVTVNPGKPLVIGGYWGGMAGTIENAENISVRCDGGLYFAEEDGTLVFETSRKMGRVPTTVVLYNNGEEAAEITISFAYPAGSFENPEPIFNPSNVTVYIAFGDEDGHYYKWIAQADGTLTLTCPTVEDVEYDVIITNNRSYAQRSLVNDGADGKVSIDVKAGDEIIINVIVIPTVEDWGSYTNELNTTLKGSFEFAPGTFENPDVIDSIDEIVIDLAEGDKDGYYYQWTADKKGLYTFTAPENAGYDVIVTINSVQKSFAYDAVNGYLTISVKAEDVVEIHVVAVPQKGAEGEAWTYPAVDTTITTLFTSGSIGGNLAGNVGVTVAPIDNSCNPTTSADGVTLIHAEGKDYFRFAVDFTQESTPSRYIAITYKSNGISAIGGYFYGCKNAAGNEFDYGGDTKISGSKYAFIDDGEWHTIIIDTHEIMKSNHISEGYYMTKLRFQCSAASVDSTESFTIKNVELSNDLEYLNQKYQAALGSIDRPEAIDSITEIAVDLEAGDTDGYYYQWTADKKGIYTFAIPENANYTITVTANGNTVTPVNGYVSVYTIEGNTLLINVKAVPVEGAYPAVDATVNSIYSYGTADSGLAGGGAMTGDTTVYCGELTASVGADGVTYSYKGVPNPSYSIQMNNRTENERYMAITYKSNGFVDTSKYYCRIYDVAAGTNEYNEGTRFNKAVTFINDNEWHTMIIDTWAFMNGTASNGTTRDTMNGDYRLDSIRLDFRNLTEGASFTVKSIEFSNDIDYLEAKYN